MAYKPPLINVVNANNGYRGIISPGKIPTPRVSNSDNPIRIKAIRLLYALTKSDFPTANKTRIKAIRLYMP